MNIEYLATQVLPTYMKSLNINQPNEIEGIAAIGDNKIVVFYSASSGKSGAPMETDPARIQMFQIDPDPRKTTLLQDITMAGLGHVNSAGYNKDADELYVNRGMYSPTAKPDTVKYTGEIIVLNSKLQKKRTFNCTYNGKGIFMNLLSFDRVRKKLYGVARPGDLSELMEIDTSSGRCTSILKFAAISNGHFTSSQGLAVRDGMMYWQTGTPRCISVYSLDWKKLVKTISLPVSDCYGHALKYPQDLDYDDNGVFYMTAQTRSPAIGYGKSEGQWRYNYIFRLDFERDVCGVAIDADDTSRIAKKETYTVYVDKDCGKVYQNGSKEYPFSTLMEAFYSIQYRDYPAVCIEVLRGGHYDEWLVLYGITCTLQGENISINALALRNCNLVFSNEVDIIGAPKTYKGSYSTKRVLYVLGSNVIFAQPLSLEMRQTSGEIGYVENSRMHVTISPSSASTTLQFVNSLIIGQVSAGCVLKNTALINTMNCTIDKM